MYSKKILGAWSPVYMQTHAQAHTRTETQTHEWMYYKGNLLNSKSLSREVVTSAALFTRLMPCCTQERVNHSQSPSEPFHGVASFRFQGGLGIIYSRNSRVLGDVCSPALGLLVPECNVALALCYWKSSGADSPTYVARREHVV